MLSVDFANVISHISFLLPVFFFSSKVITVTLWLNFADTSSKALLSFLPQFLQESHAHQGARW